MMSPPTSSNPSSFNPMPPAAHSHESLLVNRDEEHLRLLGFFHLVFAAIHALTLLLFVVTPLLMGPAFYQQFGGGMPRNPEVVQQLLIFSLFIRGLITFIIALNGWYLRKKQHWRTCVILSILECASLVLVRDPAGLMLGISAIMVLRRESVKELFRANRPTPPVQTT